jgi:hypothetical protein
MVFFPSDELWQFERHGLNLERNRDPEFGTLPFFVRIAVIVVLKIVRVGIALANQ